MNSVEQIQSAVKALTYTINAVALQVSHLVNFLEIQGLPVDAYRQSLLSDSVLQEWIKKTSEEIEKLKQEPQGGFPDFLQ